MAWQRWISLEILVWAHIPRWSNPRPHTLPHYPHKTHHNSVATDPNGMKRIPLESSFQDASGGVLECLIRLFPRVLRASKAGTALQAVLALSEPQQVTPWHRKMCGLVSPSSFGVVKPCMLQVLLLGEVKGVSPLCSQGQKTARAVAGKAPAPQTSSISWTDQRGWQPRLLHTCTAARATWMWP